MPLLVGNAAKDDAALPAKVQFNRDIRPIFSDTCFKCHGPDANKRKADLRLDVRDDAIAKHKEVTPIVPGDPAKSDVVRRLTTKDEDDRMPPVKSGMALTERQIKLVRRWIEQGAQYQSHWAFIAPTRPSLPKVRDTRWPRNGLDHFILARLEQEGLRPSPEADKATLIRRVTLDLTGVPPTPEEVDAFLADNSRDAFEKAVDRLLASSHFGEQMAVQWLDEARYGDTHGYQNDFVREMWPWRDWVIAAYNRNLPFDQFTVEQLAGDLLPNPTLEQRVATGFNRNHRINTEGGSIAEEWRAEYVVDRVEATAAVWLGLTMGCARCHDHKFDPITQKEFYKFFAYFNSVAEDGGGNELQGNHPPKIQVITPAQQAETEKVNAQIATLEKQIASLIAGRQPAWEQTMRERQGATEAPREGLVAHFPLDAAADSKAIVSDKPAEFVAGHVGNALRFDGQRFVDAGNAVDFDRADAFSYGCWAFVEGAGGALLSKMDDAGAYRGFDVLATGGNIQAHIVSSWSGDALKVITKTPLSSGAWHHIFVTYDGSSKAAGVAVYVDGVAQPLNVEVDSLKGTIRTRQPLRIGKRSASLAFNGLLDDVRIYKRALAAAEVKVLAQDAPLRELLTVAPDKRTDAQRADLAGLFRALDPEAQKLDAEIARQRADLQKMVFPTTMVMEDLPKPRETHVFLRGQYDKPGELVTPGVPAALPPLPKDAPPNRLSLARWIVDPANPLTARVAVNRFWEKFFGTGLVKTSENFGSQSEWPSHPELLDWLATEFIRLGWDMKAFQKMIVTSATYRQSSKLTPLLREKDPENRLLARGPRFRLSGEMIRDQALAISGLLVEHLGGPSVKPYMPPGMWEELSSVGLTKYEPDKGAGLYRRSMYTFIKRTTPPPAMAVFDAPSREFCVVKRQRTNTPLQALDLLNEVTHVEAARVLAQHMISEGGATPEQRVAFAFRLATAHTPTPAQTKTLVAGLQRRLAAYRADAAAATNLVAFGESPRDPKLDVAELAAYTTTASVILNLDKTVTKE